ncbi:spore coat protein [Oceanobacillus sojae]|uniref:spore coat protein n=1 Tax=Oceanobacillus sojae TaxID=582851 RepID=UPI0021A893D8|nr:spore coat protein [Oceanobacillus sojae]MCT1903106.1 spore coat protein [Oceanobacillus sojae]
MSQNNCQCSRCRNSNRDEEVRVHPTRHEVRNSTSVKTVKNIHPTEIKNVHRTVIRNENYYPVRESNVNETVVENYDCGSDVNNSSNCRRVGGSNNGGNGNNCGNHSNHCQKENNSCSRNNSCGRKRPCCGNRNRNWFF